VELSLGGFVVLDTARHPHPVAVSAQGMGGNDVKADLAVK
jgi:hypothetical protein